jgi:nucleotide-binding universal stress UspA family protein
MKTLESRTRIALKNILFATDFEVSASRALPFAVALAKRYGAKLYAVHAIPPEAYALGSPESVDRVLAEARDFAGYTLNQLLVPLRSQGLSCNAMLGEGKVTEVIEEFVHKRAADLLVVGTSSRMGLGKMFLGSVAEELIRDSPCPVLTVGPHVTTLASSGVQCILCATDFSPASTHAVEFAVSLAEEYQAHLTMLHVLDGKLPTSLQYAIESSERRLRQALPSEIEEIELPFAPELVVEAGAVADRVVNLAGDLSSDIIVMGANGVGAFAETASRLGSIVHRVIAFAPCPVLTVHNVQKLET